MKFKISKESLFYLAWILMEIHIVIANSNAASFSVSAVSYFCMILFVIKIIWTLHYTFKEICLMGTIMIGGLLSLRASADMRVLWFVIVLCASKHIDFNKTVKYSFRTMLGCCITFVLLYLTGVIDGAHYASARGLRMSFGLGHPNMCSAYYSLLMMHIIYLYFDKIKLRHYFLFTAGAAIVYMATKSNTGFLTAMITILVAIIIKYMPAKRFNIKAIILGLVIGITIFTILPIIYDSRFSALDILMTGRLHQANFYFTKYGISLFGNDVNYDLNVWNTDNILDLGYAKLIINNGIFYYSLVVGGYIICMRKVAANKQRKLMTLYAPMIVYMYAENVGIYIFMNVSMLAFSQIIFKENLFSSKIEERMLTRDATYKYT